MAIALSTLARDAMRLLRVPLCVCGYMASSDARDCTEHVVALQLAVHVVARCNALRHVQLDVWLTCLVARTWLHGAWFI